MVKMKTCKRVTSKDDIWEVVEEPQHDAIMIRNVAEPDCKAQLFSASLVEKVL